MSDGGQDWVVTACALGLLAFGVAGLRGGSDAESIVLLVLATSVLATQALRRLLPRSRRFSFGSQGWSGSLGSIVDLVLGTGASAALVVTLVTGEAGDRMVAVIGLVAGLALTGNAILELKAREPDGDFELGE